MTTFHMQGNTLAGFRQCRRSRCSGSSRYRTETTMSNSRSATRRRGVTSPFPTRINVEGQNVVNNFTPSTRPPPRRGANRFQVATKTVTVADGFLTVDAIGGINTKIDYIIVTPNSAAAVPAQPTALTATAGDASVTPPGRADRNPDTDLKGYNVFRVTTAPVATTGTPLNGGTLLTASTFTDTTAALTTPPTATSSSLSTTPTRRPGIRQRRPATPAAARIRPSPRCHSRSTSRPRPRRATPGFTRPTVFRRPIAAGRGWVTPSTHTPLNLSVNGRFRAALSGWRPLTPCSVA